MFVTTRVPTFFEGRSRSSKIILGRMQHHHPSTLFPPRRPHCSRSVSKDDPSAYILLNSPPSPKKIK
jgi:hypothetical protein